MTHAEAFVHSFAALPNPVYGGSKISDDKVHADHIHCRTGNNNVAMHSTQTEPRRTVVPAVPSVL